MALRPRQGEEVVLQRRDRSYWCRRDGEGLVIRNAAGEERRLERIAPSASSGAADALDVATGGNPALRRLFHDAAMALGLAG